MSIKISTWIGRLGNNIMQVKHVIQIGLYYNYNIILPPHNFFNTTHIIFNPDIINKSEHVIYKYDHFCYDKTDFVPNNEAFNLNVDKTLNILKNIFTIKSDPKNKFDDDNVVIHIRSGDIFSKKPPGHYICPPLSYYTDILNKNKFKKIYILTEDLNNPCTNKLIELFPDIILRINNKLEDDIMIILNTQNIICSYGTFIPCLLLLSENIRNIYRVRHDCCYNFMKDIININKNIKLNNLDYDDYKSKIIVWKNNPDQQDIMINYKNT